MERAYRNCLLLLFLVPALSFAKCKTLGFNEILKKYDDHQYEISIQTGTHNGPCARSNGRFGCSFHKQIPNYGPAVLITTTTVFENAGKLPKMVVEEQAPLNVPTSNGFKQKVPVYKESPTCSDAVKVGKINPLFQKYIWFFGIGHACQKQKPEMVQDTFNRGKCAEPELDEKDHTAAFFCSAFDLNYTYFDSEDSCKEMHDPKRRKAREALEQQNAKTEKNDEVH